MKKFIIKIEIESMTNLKVSQSIYDEYKESYEQLDNYLFHIIRQPWLDEENNYKFLIDYIEHIIQVNKLDIKD